MTQMTKMNIPKTITAGYNERTDTYTKKLAYVIYTDEKGKLRKETSWEGWRQKKLGRDDFDNEPMSGFVLNKGVGGARQSYSSNARNEYIRIYDPRGFEFEISVANLLFILQECTSTRGKGLEGDFVYAWAGKDLVLLPTCSQEYIECSKFTAHQSGKVTKADMVEGCTYLMKDMTEVMYLGRHDYYEPKSYRSGSEYDGAINRYTGKKHIFVKPSGARSIPSEIGYGSHYIVQTGFTKLGSKINNEVLPNFAKEYKKFTTSYYACPTESAELEEIKLKMADFTNTRSYFDQFKFALAETKELYRTVNITKNDHDETDRSWNNPKIVKKKNDFTLYISGDTTDLTTDEHGGIKFPGYRGKATGLYNEGTIGYGRNKKDDPRLVGTTKQVTLKELQAMDIYRVHAVLSYGKKFKLFNKR